MAYGVDCCNSCPEVQTVNIPGVPGTDGAAEVDAGLTPETFVTASPGAFYYSSTDSSLWIKESGFLTNTGWVKLIGMLLFLCSLLSLSAAQPPILRNSLTTNTEVAALTLVTNTINAAVLTRNTLWLDSVRGSDTSDSVGHINRPWRTLRAAMTNALPFSTIKVRSGNYRVTDTVSQSDSTLLIGDGLDSTFITNALNRTINGPYTNGAAITIGNNANVSDLTVINEATLNAAQNAPGIGFIVPPNGNDSGGSTNFLVQNVRIDGGTTALYLRSTNGFSGTVRNCEFNSSKDSFAIIDGSGVGVTSTLSAFNIISRAIGPNPIGGSGAYVEEGLKISSTAGGGGNYYFRDCYFYAANPTANAPDGQPDGTTNAAAVFLSGTNNYITFEGCTFESANTNTDGSLAFDIWNDTNNPANVTLIGCSYDTNKVSGPVTNVSTSATDLLLIDGSVRVVSNLGGSQLGSTNFNSIVLSNSVYDGFGALRIMAGDLGINLRIPYALGSNDSAVIFSASTNGQTTVRSYSQATGILTENIRLRSTNTYILNPFGNGITLSNIGPGGFLLQTNADVVTPNRTIYITNGGAVYRLSAEAL
jgi:hypothetical protein